MEERKESTAQAVLWPPYICCSPCHFLLKTGQSWKQATAIPALGRLIHKDQESEAILGYREIQDNMGHLMSSYLLFINKYILKKLKCHVNYPALRRLIHEQEFEASLGYRVIQASLGYLLTPVLKKIKIRNAMLIKCSSPIQNTLITTVHNFLARGRKDSEEMKGKTRHKSLPEPTGDEPTLRLCRLPFLSNVGDF